MSKWKKILGIVIVAILAFIIVISLVAPDNNNGTQNNVMLQDEVIEENNREIPEDKKVVVSFVSEEEVVYEDREIERSRLLNYLETLNKNINKSAVSIGLAPMQKSGVLYYIEYRKDGYLKKDYGCIYYCNLISTQTSSTLFESITVYLGETSRMAMSSFVSIRDNRSYYPPTDTEETKNSNMFTDIVSLIPDGVTDIRFGIIEPAKNEWIYEHYGEENTQNESSNENITNNTSSNINEDNHESNEVKNNYESPSNNTSVNTSNITENTTNNNTENTNTYENYHSPSILIDNGSGSSTTNENYTLEYSVSNVYDNAEIIIKHNNKVISQKTTNSNSTLKENIVLTEGSNNIEISVTNSAGKTSTESKTITYTISTPKVTIDTSSPSTTRYSSYNFSYFYYDAYSTQPVDVIIKLNGVVVKERTKVMATPSETVNLEVGENIRIHGRIQSRDYQKKISETETVTKTAYEISISKMETNEKNKTSIKKIGVGVQQEKDTEYEYMVTFNIAQDTHVATVMKDNTGLFDNKFDVLNEKDGEALYDWANSGNEPVKAPEYDLPKLREDIIARAKELGGSKNPSVKEACERLIGTLNPNKSEDGKALTQLLDELKAIEVSKEGDK